MVSSGNHIRRFRKDKGLTLPELAERAKVSKGYLSQLERGEIEGVSARILMAISKELGVTIADLMGESLVDERTPDISKSLLEFRSQYRHLGVSDEDLEMLAKISFRGEQPKTADGWFLVYMSIKQSVDLEQEEE